MVSMIDRYLLRYFLAVVDNGTFSRGAAQANVSQPTLSVGIAKLERLLGTTLFQRSSQRVHLTDAGTRFLTHARRIEGAFNDAELAVKGAKAMPLVRLGVLGSVATDLIAAAYARARLADPQARVELVEGTERELVSHVARGRVDVALTLVGRGGDRFLEEPLHEEGYALALPTSHPLAQEAVIAAEVLASEVMIVRRHCEALSETSRHFTERGVRPFFALRSTNDDKVLKMVAAGLGITVMPEGHSAPGVARPRMAGFTPRRTIGLLYAAHAEALKQDAPPIVDALRHVLGVGKQGVGSA
jgi:DNA-binding transcriptional LysR family regulator